MNEWRTLSLCGSLTCESRDHRDGDRANQENG